MGGEIAVGLLVLIGVVLVLLDLGRRRDGRELARLWRALAQPGEGEPFREEMVGDLPAPARRYLRRAIAPGTPLAASVTLRMSGAIRLQPGRDPLPMSARQVLATPRGLIWKARVGSGLMRISGDDRYAGGEGRMCWRLWGLIPVVSAGGPDITRSAAGRVAVEAIWLPSALLPWRGARWEAIDESRARVRLRVDDEECALTLQVDPEGRLQRVETPRWKDDAGDGAPGYVPFGADEFADEATFGGYTLPTRLRAGWRLGAEQEFAFFFAVLETAEFGGEEAGPAA